MDKDLKKYIFAYLDKRHTIDGNMVCFKENYPEQRLRDIFDIKHSDDIIGKWAQNRFDDAYCFTYPDGTQEWYKNGEFHRNDGPAVIYEHGHKEWWLNGDLHREDGPAVIYPSGEEWWLNGKYYLETKYKMKIKELKTKTGKNG